MILFKETGLYQHFLYMLVTLVTQMRLLGFLINGIIAGSEVWLAFFIGNGILPLQAGN